MLEIARSFPHQIISLETKTQKKNSPPPFTTSSLQQSAGAKLKFNPEKTMQIAQHLFESGLITYHRTDSQSVSDDFIAAARKYLQERDPRNLPDKPRRFKSKKNAQEAHEAIRPSDLTKSSTLLKQELDSEHFALYELIWRRAIASQCNPAKIEKTRITTQSGSALWLARGQIVKFLGYARYWRDLGKDAELPEVNRGQSLTLKEAKSEEKVTQPPSRYSEAKLVQILEKNGIGRPSTYSSTIKTLKQRDYVKVSKGKLVATELGLAVDNFQSKAFPKLVASEFTAEMEDALDAIANGDLEWQSYFINWNNNYFDPALEKANSIAATESVNNVKLHQTSSLPRTTKRKSSPTKLKLKGKTKSPPTITNKYCPFCNSSLAERSYNKDGKNKKMLVCSNSKRDKQCENVVYFLTKKNRWWSPKLGEI